uniref:MBL fold metallo-hydrolase n=1 Tax=Heterorhabditis bacteriophora TaxID=37862 RepID=A0A1I7WQH9_HETBA
MTIKKQIFFNSGSNSPIELTYINVDRTKSLESDPFPSGRRLTLMDEIPEIGQDEAVDI